MSGYSGCIWDHGFQPTTGFIFLPSERGIQVTNIWNMWMGWNRPPVMTRGMDISYGRMISWSFLKMVAADPISISSSPIHHPTELHLQAASTSHLRGLSRGSSSSSGLVTSGAAALCIVAAGAARSRKTTVPRGEDGCQVGGDGRGWEGGRRRVIFA